MIANYYKWLLPFHPQTRKYANVGIKEYILKIKHKWNKQKKRKISA